MMYLHVSVSVDDQQKAPHPDFDLKVSSFQTTDTTV